MQHRLLSRQLKRSLGLDGALSLEAFLHAAEQAAQSQAGPVARALLGLRLLLQKIDEAYAQYDRDLTLSSRSLDISSSELLEANLSIRAEASAQQRVVQHLRESMHQLALSAGVNLPDEGDAGLEALSSRIAQLVAEHKTAQTHLRASEAKFRSLTELSTDWYWEQDAQLRFVSTAGRSDGRGGLAPSDHVGRRRWELPNTHPVSCTWEEHKAQLAAREPFRDLVLRRDSAEGDSHFVLVSGVPMFDSEDHFCGYQGIARDITASVKAEEALRGAKQAADAASMAKSQFLANMSHEMRTPLNGLLGIAELLQEETLSPSQREKVGLLVGSGRSLLAIINDVLDFSKIEAGRLDLEQIDFDPSGLVERVGRLFAPQAQSKGLAFEFSCDAALPRALVGDPLRLQQALTNLVGNAIKFTDRGNVFLRAQRMAAGVNDDSSRSRVRIEVEDSGIGLSPETAATLFTPFTQADASTTRRFGGTGLGLAISKQIIERMGGTIGVKSLPGQGSVFWIELALPVGCSEPQAECASHDVVGSSARFAGVRVLIVEDNPVNMLVARAMLDRLGVAITAATDGEAALRELRNAPFDLALMDCHMPRMDGYEAVRLWRAEESAAGRTRMPIVALTANAMAGDAEASLAAGFDDHIGKPFTRAQLAAAVARWAPVNPSVRVPSPTA